MMKKRWTGLMTAVFLFLTLLCPPAAGEAAFELPSGLEIISKETFENVSVDQLTLPEGVSRIESRAFAGSGLNRLWLPDSVTHIADDAFDGCSDLCIYAKADSYAATWCAGHNVTLYSVQGLCVTPRTRSEIRAFEESHPADRISTITFRQQPKGGEYSDEAYYPGLISEASIASGINMLNQVRFIAGLNADVTHDPTRELMESAASLVHALNQTISHSPSRPEEMSDASYDELYELACEASGSSNLYAGVSNLAYAILGYVCDSGSNMQTVGHRRWILNPSMGTTTFGYHYQSTSRWRHYSCMYAFDKSGSGSETLVAWPAQQTPLSHYLSPSSQPWSLSFGRALDADTIEVILTRRSDGNTWRFSSASADGSFYVNNNWYGKPGCVIFLPHDLGSISNGDVFDVSVIDHSNQLAVRYTVSFFD